MTWLERGEDFRMRKIDPIEVTGRRIGIEPEICPRHQRDGFVLEGADAQFWPLQVDKRSDRPAILLFDVADDAHKLTHAIMRGMAHVDAEHIGARDEQRRNGDTIARGRTKGRDDLGAAAPPHRAGLPVEGSDCDDRAPGTWASALPAPR